MMNKVMLIGRIANDLDLNKTVNGTDVLKFRLACERYSGKEKVTDFIPCVAWSKSAVFMTQYCHKGDLMSAEAHIKTGSYEKDGIKVYTTEVECENVKLLASKKAEENY